MDDPNVNAWGLLKLWRPQKQWLGNEITGDWSAENISVTVKQLGESHYMVMIAEENDAPTYGHGASSVSAIFAAIMSNQFRKGIMKQRADDERWGFR
jgi:hypothetical protein